MSAVSPVPHEPDPERPSPAAQLKITARQLGSAEGIVPPAAAKHLIAAFGILGCVTAGIAGAVLTLRIAPSLTTPALAELALALLSALLIGAGGWVRDRGETRPPSDQEPGEVTRSSNRLASEPSLLPGNQMSAGHLT
jgi:hypothetical protein